MIQGARITAALPRRSVAGLKTGTALVGGVVLNVALAVGLASGRTTPVIAVAVLLPALVVISIAIVGHRDWLVLAALLLTMLGGSLTERLPGTGGTAIYPADLVVALALAGYVIERLISVRGSRRERRSTFILTWPLALLALTLMVAVVRGHGRYGSSYVSEPTRIFIYAGIAVAIFSMRMPVAYRQIVRVFYIVTVVQALIGTYHLASGTSQTNSVTLSTGGTRALALTTAMFLAGALVLALLNLEIDARARRTTHFAIAGLATYGIVISLGRTTYAAVAVVVPVLLLGLRRLRRTMLAYAPLLLAVLTAIVALALQSVPSLGSTLGNRFNTHVGNDTSLVQRQRKFAATLQGFGKEPILGLGFGRPVTFKTIDGREQTFSGDPENSYIYVLAGGGILALGALITVILAFLADAVYRLRKADGEDRALIVFAMSLVFIFLVNALSYPLLSDPSLTLMLWIALLLPSIARSKSSGDASTPQSRALAMRE
jgi:O-antigen ligase